MTRDDTGELDGFAIRGGIFRGAANVCNAQAWVSSVMNWRERDFAFEEGNELFRVAVQVIS